jgi:hypothetical protein
MTTATGVLFVSTLGQEYAKLVRTVADRYGTFPPSTKLIVGDYYQMKGGSLTRLGSASTLPGWRSDLTVRTDLLRGQETYYAGSSRRRGGSTSGGADSLIGGADCSIEVTFNRTGGFILDYIAESRTYFDDLRPVMQWILAASKNGFWERDWVLITETISAKSASILVGAKKSQKIELRAQAKLPADILGLNLADPKLKLTASDLKEGGFVSLAKSATPIYGFLRIRRDLFFRKQAELASDAGEDLAKAFAEEPFDDV